MNIKVGGLFATAMTLALTGAVSAQSNTSYFQQPQAVYQTPTTVQPTAGQPLYAPSNVYAAQPTNIYAPRQAGTAYAAPPATNIQQTTTTYSNTTPSYASPYTPTAQTTRTVAAPSYRPANTATYQQNVAPRQVYQQQPFARTIPAQKPRTLVPAKAITSSVPTSTAPVGAANELQDNDSWSFNLARFYPAIQACLRKSAAKNPVIANIHVSNNKTNMLIGEGGSSSFSTCSTGLTGTVVKANSDIRSLPSAFFAPLGSTFTVAPDRPFQPIIDTDQKVIGWLVRTQPTRAVNQFGQAVGFDGQFIPPVMVNTTVGKS